MFHSIFLFLCDWSPPCGEGFPCVRQVLHIYLPLIWAVQVFLNCISQLYFSDMKRVPPHIRSFDLSYASMPLLCLESPTGQTALKSQGDQMTFLLCQPCQYSHNLYDISLEGWGWQRQRQRQRQDQINFLLRHPCQCLYDLYNKHRDEDILPKLSTGVMVLWH